MPGKRRKKAASKSQQRLFGMVSAYQNGKLKLDDLSPSLANKIKGIADGDKGRKKITKKAAAELASTKHKGKPERVKESIIINFSDYINEGSNLDKRIIKFNEMIDTDTLDQPKTDNFLGKVKKEFNIDDWNSDEGVKKRKKIASDLGNLYTKITKSLKSSVSDKEKAKLIHTLITGSAYLAIIIGLWNMVHPDMVSLVDWDFQLLGKDIDIEFGKRPEGFFVDTLKWAKVALFLFLLRFTHSLLVQGRNFKENVKDMFGRFINLFKKVDNNKVTESSEWVLDMEYINEKLTVYL